MNYSTTNTVNFYFNSCLDENIEWWVSHNIEFKKNNSRNKFVCKNCCNKLKNNY